jgi:hypothetical protein
MHHLIFNLHACFGLLLQEVTPLLFLGLVLLRFDHLFKGVVLHILLLLLNLQEILLLSLFMPEVVDISLDLVLKASLVALDVTFELLLI